MVPLEAGYSRYCTFITYDPSGGSVSSPNQLCSANKQREILRGKHADVHYWLIWLSNEKFVPELLKCGAHSMNFFVCQMEFNAGLEKIPGEWTIG